jgi:hypothetical protein
LIIYCPLYGEKFLFIYKFPIKKRKPLRETDSVCYLGSAITTDGGVEVDIRNRLNRARAAFTTLKPVWVSTKLKTMTKLRIFNSNVKSVLLYACESWLASKQATNLLQTFVNWCLRCILKIYWPAVILKQQLWQITQQEPTELEIKRRKWKWLGHTLRRPQTDIKRATLDWNPQGSRRRGRPTNTCNGQF